MQNANANAKCRVLVEDWRSAVSGQRKAVLDRVQRHGGLLAYLGTDDVREVEARIGKGDRKAKLVYDAMVYQIAKEIGAYSVVPRGQTRCDCPDRRHDPAPGTWSGSLRVGFDTPAPRESSSSRARRR